VVAAASPRCALGTSFLAALVRHGRPAAHAAALLDEAEALGADALYLDETVLADGTGALLGGLGAELVRRRRSGSVLGLEAGLGAHRLGRPRARLASACALDREEALAATEVAGAALALAAELQAPTVTLRLGAVAGLRRHWERARAGLLRGALQEDERLAEQLLEARSGLLPPHLEMALRSAERIANLALRHGVTVLLPSPRRAIELPAPLELQVLLAELRGAPLRPMLDLPAAHLASTMRLLPLRPTVLAFADGPLHLLGDACGAVGALPPGRGEVDVAAVARALSASAHRGFLPWRGLHLREVAAGYHAVAGLAAGALAPR
jgi:sugar phosphate isomerase/epimerase